MTDETRIEEIRKRYAAYLGGDRHAYSRADVYAPDDVGELLAALDAERAAHAETRAETVRYGADINRAIADGANHLHDSEAKRVAQQTRIVELERALVDMRFTACAVLVWACDSHPDTVTAVRTVKALAEAYVEATAQRDAERARAERAEAERDARPAITVEDAAGWDRDRSMRRNDDTWRQDRASRERVEDAIRAHAAKVRTSPARCEICDWPLHDTIDKGCTAESCSYRPDVGSEEHRRIAARRKEIAAKAGGGT